MKSAVHRQILILGVLGAAFAGLVLAGCGSSDEDAPPAPDYAKKLAGSPPPLAALHEQSDELLDGGQDAFNDRMAGLEGYPAVVNVWASWCGPCRAEFPYFQQLSAKLGKKVAFLGVNAADADDLAQDLLSDFPVPYPSYKDPHRDIADDLDARNFPATAFFDADGNLNYTHIGAFPDKDELEAEIRRYAINSETAG